ncbi:MAG: glycosyltransferase, partial [Burkholderiales bacterium]|nr:glycosyltransferase [Burkholderiales bacterium]
VEASVSAVIPAYNCARFLPAAVASVRAQSRPAREIVVVDDGSTDGTASVAAALGPDVRVVTQANAGPSAARNRGVGLCSGDLVAFLDADDEWLPEAIERQVEVLRRFPDAALTTADMAAIDEDGRVTHPSWFDRHGLAAEVRGWGGRPVPNAVAALMRKNFVSTSVLVVRRDVFMELGGFRPDLRYGEDLELWARIAARCPVVCLPEVLGRRRAHPHNTTKSVEPMLKDLVRMTEIVRGWGRDVLRAQGADADEMVARARTDLGYWYFTAGRLAEARAALGAALRDDVSARALRYFLLSCLPLSAVNGLRRVKATFDA